MTGNEAFALILGCFAFGMPIGYLIGSFVGSQESAPCISCRENRFTRKMRSADFSRPAGLYCEDRDGCEVRRSKLRGNS